MSRFSHAPRFARTVLILVALIAALGVRPPRAGADDDCRRDGKACFTNRGCCSRLCFKKPATSLFGTCCTHTTCAAHGATCGTIPDGTCPDALDCGSCTSPNTCGGGGTPNVCGCTPIKVCPAGLGCGSIPDGCGGTVSCGICLSPNTCGGGGTANVCGCTPFTSCPGGADCGSAPNGCGGTLSCGGACTTPNTCGGGGVPNVCGCTPRTCGDVGASGGTISDGCGGTVDCGPSCGPPCTRDADCDPALRCVAGRCEHKLEPDHACLRHDDCRTDCCCNVNTEDCGATTVPTQSLCKFEQDCQDIIKRHECPGAPCGQDSDCYLDNQFCTGGFCRAKQRHGAPCVFSSGCFGDAVSAGCCCVIPAAESVCMQAGSCPPAGGACQ